MVESSNKRKLMKDEFVLERELLNKSHLDAVRVLQEKHERLTQSLERNHLTALDAEAERTRGVLGEFYNIN